MIGPARASNPDSPITVARQRVLRCYQQRHRGRLLTHVLFVTFFSLFVFHLQVDIIGPLLLNASLLLVLTVDHDGVFYVLIE